ncbi:chemotaxis protein CheA [Simiduia agarivorans]|uniref:Chemotaxis protein CheA n=1 Tax=Simiduia agarivorans (strain DSM 21679 / JCM 13881 / BCRC 17597 / SA1) TaxID=1117647 RepID=K4KTM2_SIMAS|nr:chemotaxis protein CheA [Simiduia agarivorans]AFU97317.1 CheA signal transduction histidine kinase [Simiduia agarivorans SA1 = DSM 21679]
MSIDLSQFHQIFFDESLEGLDAMEQALLDVVKNGNASDSVINTIFRAAHSIKGGGGTFGFSDIAELTHHLETVLDQVRSHQRDLSDEVVEVAFQSCDILRRMIAGHQQKQPVPFEQYQGLHDSLVQLAEAGVSPSTIVAPKDTVTETVMDPVGHKEFAGAGAGADGTAVKSAPGERGGYAGGNQRWFIRFCPQPDILLTGNEPSRIFRELATLAKLDVRADSSRLPAFGQLEPDECFLSWKLCLEGDVSEAQIEEVFEWVSDSCELDIKPVSQVTVNTQAPVAGQATERNTLTESAPTENNAVADDALPDTHQGDNAITKPDTASGVQVTTASISSGEPTASQSTSIRVSTDRVDDLINLVGELVITQSMLNDMSRELENERFERLISGLQQLTQQTRDLQESVMRIRMLPISFVFNRFPRMLHDLSAKMGKRIRLDITGEQTELDKTVMERIGDPLVHLIRNAVDHGIEPAEIRLASDKPAEGVISLRAFHQGGNIVIEVKDDGAGIQLDRVRSRAVEKNLLAPNQTLTQAEAIELLFHPGFSTAEAVSEVSGRGVGMDVVRANIHELGGSIAVESEPGKGSRFRIQLPLTLAIVDGQLLGVAGDVYVAPLLNIVESVQVRRSGLRKAAANQCFYTLRDENIPVVSLEAIFGFNPQALVSENVLIVVVEAAGQKLALLVDELLGQQQVVIKSLSKNYRKVDGLAGATILGDGRVALILDVPGLYKLYQKGIGRRGLYAVA